MSRTTSLNRGLVVLHAAATLGAAVIPVGAAYADASVTAFDELQEIVVTAQKRKENIQDVGLSVAAATGETLSRLGVRDTADLQKIIPGFVATPSYSGVTLYTIRGVGFQDTALAGSPTVSVYVDEAPLPYSVLTAGATFDLERVEMDKGPQGTLFGNNATGGAVNYIANKPTREFSAGQDLSYGRFSDVNFSGFVSGPIGSEVAARLAVESHTSGAWQKGYGPQSGQEIGGADLIAGRAIIDFTPTDRLKEELTVHAWRDKSYNQAGQFFALARHGTGDLSPIKANYPVSPHNDQAAGWVSCVNTAPYAPVAGQTLGTTFPAPDGTPISEGGGSAVQAGAQPTSCIPNRRDNNYYSVANRLEFNVSSGIQLTSLTEFQHFDRLSGQDEGGVPVIDTQLVQGGSIKSFFQELRLSRDFGARGGHWIAGVNYQHDNTVDTMLATNTGSSQAPYFGTLAAGPINVRTQQQKSDYAAYGNADLPIIESLSLVLGARYTLEDIDAQLCTYDSGDGTWAQLMAIVSGLSGGPGTNVGKGGCATLNSAFVPGIVRGKLDQHNESWRAGLNWKPTRDVLAYVNVSQGYKGGSFPTIAMSAASQAKPVVQEGLLSYELGVKSALFDHQLTLNGAGYYYDYTNKQILGAEPVFPFGALAALVNVPKSHVVGFELSAVARPRILRGLTLTPSVSYQKSHIDGCDKADATTCVNGQFYNYDNWGSLTKLTGQAFPYAPQWQADLDAEYAWAVKNDLRAYVGVNVSHTDGTHSSFLNPDPPPSDNYNPLVISSYTLVDLRAGIEKDHWSIQVWAKNVTNKWYWPSAYALGDTAFRVTGMPRTYGVTFSNRL